MIRSVASPVSLQIECGSLNNDKKKKKVFIHIQTGVLLPVDDAEASVVGEVAVVGSLPGDSGPRAAANFTPEGDALAVVTRDIAQRHEELGGNWERQCGVGVRQTGHLQSTSPLL